MSAFHDVTTHRCRQLIFIPMLALASLTVACGGSEESSVEEARSNAQDAWDMMNPGERDLLCADLAILDSRAAIALIVEGNQRTGDGELSEREAEIAYDYWRGLC